MVAPLATGISELKVTALRARFASEMMAAKTRLLRDDDFTATSKQDYTVQKTWEGFFKDEKSVIQFSSGLLKAIDNPKGWNDQINRASGSLNQFAKSSNLDSQITNFVKFKQRNNLSQNSRNALADIERCAQGIQACDYMEANNITVLFVEGAPTSEQLLAAARDYRINGSFGDNSVVKTEPTFELNDKTKLAKDLVDPEANKKTFTKSEIVNFEIGASHMAAAAAGEMAQAATKATIVIATALSTGKARGPYRRTAQHMIGANFAAVMGTGLGQTAPVSQQASVVMKSGLMPSMLMDLKPSAILGNADPAATNKYGFAG